MCFHFTPPYSNSVLLPQSNITYVFVVYTISSMLPVFAMRLSSNFLSVVISTSSYNPPFGTRAPFITCKLRAASSIVIFTYLFLSGICSTPFIIIDSILFSCSV